MTMKTFQGNLATGNLARANSSINTAYITYKVITTTEIHAFFIAGRGPAYFWTTALRPLNGSVC